MPAGRPAKRVAPAVRPPSARRAAPTRLTEPDLPAPPVRRRRIASAAAGRPDDLPKDTTSTASMVAIVTREVLKQLREDRDAALPPPSLPAPVLPAPEMPVAAPLDLAVTGALSSLEDSNIYPGVRSVPRGPLASLASRPNPTGTSTLAPVMLRLLNAALTEGTRHAYKHAITSSVFPASIVALAAFVAHLFSQNYAPATLLTYMSALSYVQKLADMADPTQHFVIKKLLAGAQKLAAKPDTRLDPDKYKGHSFRIGAATAAADSGLSETQIQTMGRWKSSAFKRYVRIPVLRMSQR
ncbi:hypothetical protein NP493_1618g00010 [Ridgeia piscesae]|uniref:Tyr recombinase domain-containing protein n=1 Tax=Ridgeia piscesae TaxID=27915 RepID=A0AAD9JXI5_RIDPI|nr:hypothetical protein NP493_1618g00010 [Ridgeia piscesae]